MRWARRARLAIKGISLCQVGRGHGRCSWTAEIEPGFEGSGVQAAGAAAGAVFQARHGGGGGIHLRPGRWGRNGGPADRLAAAGRCKPCQGKLKSNVFASCHKYKQQQRFSGRNSCLAISGGRLSSAAPSLPCLPSWAFTEAVQGRPCPVS